MKQQVVWKEERERGISKMIGLLKFITCGSVDDGKSTLIGHILYDSKLLYADQEKALELDSKVVLFRGACQLLEEHAQRGFKHLFAGGVSDEYDVCFASAHRTPGSGISSPGTC